VFKGIGPQQVYGEIGIDHKNRTLLDQFVEGGFKEPVVGHAVGVPVTGSAARPSFSDPVTAALQLSRINLHPRVLKDGTTQLISPLLMSRMAFTLNGPLSRLTNFFPNPADPRTLGANTPMPLASRA
jgi:hypothetical protein